MLNFLQIVIFFSQKLVEVFDLPFKKKVSVLNLFEHFKVMVILFGWGSDGEIFGFIELSDVCGFVDHVLLLLMYNFIEGSVMKFMVISGAEGVHIRVAFFGLFGAWLWGVKVIDE